MSVRPAGRHACPEPADTLPDYGRHPERRVFRVLTPGEPGVAYRIVFYRDARLPQPPQLRLLVGSHSTGARNRGRRAVALATAPDPVR